RSSSVSVPAPAARSFPVGKRRPRSIAATSASPTDRASSATKSKSTSTSKPFCRNKRRALATSLHVFLGRPRKGRPFFLPETPHMAPARTTADELPSLIEDATADYALGDSDAALAKLARATDAAPPSFEAWHALAEVSFSLRRLDLALAAAEK